MLSVELAIIPEVSFMIRFTYKGNFNNTEKLFAKAKRLKLENILRKYGDLGVQALAESTPTRSGTTAASWSYEFHGGSDFASIIWTNSHTNKGVNIAMILQFGHGTGTGGYVQGRDYINPAIQPIFDQMVDSIRKEVLS